MNRQIEELHRKAELLAHPIFKDEALRNRRLYDEIFIPILVGLVVSECAEVVADAVDHRLPASTYVDKILEHFGVEE